MLSHDQKNALPVELPSRSVNNVGDVDAIETFAAIDKNFRRQKFLRSQHPRAHPLDHCRFSKFDP